MAGAGAGAGAGARAAADSPKKIEIGAYINEEKINSSHLTQLKDALASIGVNIIDTNPIKTIASQGSHICGRKFSNEHVKSFLLDAEFFLVALDNETGNYVGFATLKVNEGLHKGTDDPKSNLYVDLLCGRGYKGVGQTLLLHVENIAKHMGKETLDLNALAYSDLVEYYKKHGFHILPKSKQRALSELVSMQKNLTGTRVYNHLAMQNINVKPIHAPGKMNATTDIPAQTGIYLFEDPQRDLQNAVEQLVKIATAGKAYKTNKTKKAKAKRQTFSIISGNGIEGLPEEPNVYKLLSSGEHKCLFEKEKCDRYTSSMIIYKYTGNARPLTVSSITDFTFAYFDTKTSSLTFECFCAKEGTSDVFIGELQTIAKMLGFYKMRFNKPAVLTYSDNLPLILFGTGNSRYTDIISLKGGGTRRKHK